MIIYRYILQTATHLKMSQNDAAFSEKLPILAAPIRFVAPLQKTIGLVVPYELYELYDWGKVPELCGTL